MHLKIAYRYFLTFIKTSAERNNFLVSDRFKTKIHLKKTLQFSLYVLMCYKHFVPI